ncbi:MAG: sensor histidine kinase, partial [Vicinamibacteria bacterium]
HAYRRRSLATAARLRAAEANRVAKSRQMIEARLTAMQARVEPQFLFNTLAQVGELHRRDPGRALDMLDRLIDYLRAAMPKMRDTSSTVAQEVELARAYLDIVRLRLGDRLRVSIDVPPEASVARMPPMMLLPLIDHTVVRGLGPASEGGAVRIAAEVAGGRLRLTLVDSGAAIVPDADAEGIAAIRQRLEALYGSDATLDVHRAGGRATEALLDLPLESPSVLNATSDRSAS